MPECEGPARLPVERSWMMDPPKTFKGRAVCIAARVTAIDKLLLTVRMARDSYHLLLEFHHDFIRALRHTSAVLTGTTRAKQAALITMGYHAVEKGLSLPSPRPNFGQTVISVLLSRLERYISEWGTDELAVTAISALKEYVCFNEEHGIVNAAITQRLSALIRSASGSLEECGTGGTKLVLRADLLRDAKLDLRAFFASRASVRQYTPEPVALEDVHAAVEVARRTPSCCNRQPWRVWIFADRESIRRALEIQGGARGFSQEVPLLLFVTSDLSCFQSPGERHQTLIDGGMFAMSLVYALHSRGLVTCCLNWSKRHRTDRLLRRAFPIPESDVGIMFISVGHPKERYAVATSWRRPVDYVVRMVCQLH